MLGRILQRGGGDVDEYMPELNEVYVGLGNEKLTVLNCRMDTIRRRRSRSLLLCTLPFG